MTYICPCCALNFGTKQQQKERTYAKYCKLAQHLLRKLIAHLRNMKGYREKCAFSKEGAGGTLGAIERSSDSCSHVYNFCQTGVTVPIRRERQERQESLKSFYYSASGGQCALIIMPSHTLKDVMLHHWASAPRRACAAMPYGSLEVPLFRRSFDKAVWVRGGNWL